MNLKKQLACIYTNNFFSGLRITDAVWVALTGAAALLAVGDRRCRERVPHGQPHLRGAERHGG